MMNTKFSERVTELLPSMRAFARSLCGDATHADDLVQNTIIRAWEHFDQFEEGTNLKAWLYTILRNCYYTDLRRRKFEIEDVDGTYANETHTEPNYENELEVRDLDKLMQDLPPEQREAVVLVFGDGMSYEEASEACQVPIGTIKSRIGRARIKLVEMIGEDVLEYA